MPDQTVQTYNENDAEHRLHPYLSMWMAHWLRACHASASPVHSRSSRHDSNEEIHDTKQKRVFVEIGEPMEARRMGMDLSPGNILEKTKAWRCQQDDMKVSSYASNATKAARIETLEEGAEIGNEAPATNSLDIRPVRSDPSLMCSLNQKGHMFLGREKDLVVCNRHAQIDGSTIDPSLSRLLRLGLVELEYPSNDTLQPESVSKSPIHGPGQSNPSQKNTSPVSRTALSKLKVSTSDRVSFEFISGRTPVKSFMYLNDGIDQDSLKVASKEHFINTNFTLLEGHCTYNSYSTFSFYDTEISNHQFTMNSENTCKSLCARKKTGSQRLHDPSTSNIWFPASVAEHDIKCEFPGSVILRSNSSPAQMTKIDELLHEHPTGSFHDVDVLKMFANVDFKKGLLGCPSRFSQTTPHFMMTNKSGFDLSKECTMISESKISDIPIGNAFIPPDFGWHERREANFQALRNNTGRVNKEESGDSKTCSLGLKNDSSAETDIVYINNYQSGNSLVGIDSFPENKDFMVDQTLSQAGIASARETRSRKKEINMLNTNQEPPGSSVAESSVYKRVSNTSITEGLDVGHTSHVEQPAKLTSTQHNAPLDQLNNRWMKRLKLSASDSIALGTKSSKKGDAKSSEKVHDFFHKIMKYSSSSEPMLTKCFDERQVELNRNNVLLRNWESSSLGSVAKDRDLPLSHPWIRRLRSRQAAKQWPKPAEPMINDPKNLKASMDRSQGKQIPSVSAMALMGRASNCFRPCEFRKKGSVIVWHSESF